MMAIHAHDRPAVLDPIAELDRLGDEIAELSAHLDAATARLLDLIRAFDARGGWNSGFRSCAAWLSWRVGLDLGAARERVRVARALGTLPLLAQALARGELSYAKVRALTRVATPETEARLLAVGRAGTAAHVERIVRSWRCVDRRAEAREAKHRHTSRALHVFQDEDGMVVVRGRLEPEAGALLLRALDAARERLFQRRRRQATEPCDQTPTRAQQQADALVLLAELTLHHELDPGAPGERYQVVVHVDAPALADPEQPGQSVLEDGVRVSAETSRRLACDASRVVMRHDRAGRVVEVDARTRTIPPALRRALQARDRGCRFPGCGVQVGQGHHIRHWAQGGRRRSRTSRSSVVATIARSTRRASGLLAGPTARSSSAGRTGERCLTSHRRPRCQPMRCSSSGRSMPRRGSASTRGLAAPAGWGSLWMSAGPSTSCILWPGQPRGLGIRSYTPTSGNDHAPLQGPLRGDLGLGVKMCNHVLHAIPRGRDRRPRAEVKPERLPPASQGWRDPRGEGAGASRRPAPRRAPRPAVVATGQPRPRQAPRRVTVTVVYLDSSALVKLVVAEPESSALVEFLLTRCCREAPAGATAAAS